MTRGERSSLLAAPRAPPRSALSSALRFARVARARLARGDAYALGNAAFVLGSAAYCVLDLLPPVGPFLDDALLVGLAALFVADALLYLRAWGGPLVGRGPCLGVVCGGGGGGGGVSGVSGGSGGKARAGDDDVDDGPTHLDLAAEWVNVAAASIYLAATVAGLLTTSTDVGVLQLALIYSLQGLSSVLFLVDALLYAASWRASAAAAADVSAGGSASGKGGGGGDGGGGGSGGGGGGGGGRGCGVACAPLLDPFFLAHTLNVLPATAYAVCGVASLALFVREAAGGRAADRYEDNRNVRGRLIAGAEPPEIEVTCIAADFGYLACSLLTVASWWTEADAEEREEEVLRGAPIV